MRLVDDPDPDVHGAVMEELKSYGKGIIPQLRESVKKLDESTTRQELADLIHEYQRKPLDDLVKLIRLHQASETDMDLEDALFLLDSFGEPDADREAISKYLDELAIRVHEIFISQSPANDLTHVLSMHSVLFEQEGFHGTTDDYYDPRNSYLSSVVSRRVGIPVSLAALELLLAERVGLDVQGVAMPYHFLLYIPEIELFIDPFHSGTFISKDDCVSFLERSGVAFNESMLSPVKNVDILVRMIRNLSFAHGRQAEVWEAQALEKALREVAPQNPS